MSNAIATSKPQASPSTPAPLPVPAERALTAFSNAIEWIGRRPTIPAHLAPTEVQRVWLAKRVEQIDGWLAPCGEAFATEQITAMASVMASRASATAESGLRMAVYAADLSDLPCEALSKACADFRRGRAGDGKWLPAPGEIRAKATAYADAWRYERHRIRTVLDAKVIDAAPLTDEQRAERKARFDGLLAELAARDVPAGKVAG
jgi:hypothetical protein